MIWHSDNVSNFLSRCWVSLLQSICCFLFLTYDCSLVSHEFTATFLNFPLWGSINVKVDVFLNKDRKSKRDRRAVLPFVFNRLHFSKLPEHTACKGHNLPITVTVTVICICAARLKIMWTQHAFSYRECWLFGSSSQEERKGEEADRHNRE